MNRFTFMVAIASLFLASGLSQAESATDNYKTYCMQCHGVKANGMGANAREMSVQPLNHSDANLMAKRSDIQLFTVIKDGGLSINRSSLMPAWGDIFTDEEIDDLVKHLRKLCQCKWAGY